MAGWQDILNQAQNIATLRQAIAADRLAHAYLFHGPEGVGKCATALELAAVLQCESKSDVACHACSSCNKVRTMQHPDVHLLLPRTTNATPEEIRAQLMDVAQNPYAGQGFDPKNAASNRQAFYPIDLIKEHLHPALRLRPHGGLYHVVVMIQADTMRAPAANAFLKLLEEPGADTVLILVTARPDLLLPTILSRCQRMRFGMIEESAIADALTERENITPELAQLHARMAGGSYATALMLAKTDSLHERRMVALNFLKHAYTRSAQQQVTIVNELIRGGRDHIKSVLHYVLVWIRDLMLQCTLAGQARIVNIDKKDIITTFASRLGKADFEAMAHLVEEGRALVGRDINLKIVLITLFHTVGQAMRSSQARKLYQPLA